MDTRNVTRKVDELGRICLPIDFRRKIGITNDNPDVDLLLTDNSIVIEKHNLLVDYEKIIRNILISEKGADYKNFRISDEDINKFIEDAKLFIDNMIIK